MNTREIAGLVLTFCVAFVATYVFTVAQFFVIVGLLLSFELFVNG